YFAARTETSSKAPGSYRPLDPAALYLTREECEARLAEWPVHRADAFPHPASATTIDFGFANARDFAPERARGDNAYEAAAKHLHAVTRSGRKAIVAAYSQGSRARIAAILGEAAKPGPAFAESWQ